MPRPSARTPGATSGGDARETARPEQRARANRRSAQKAASERYQRARRRRAAVRWALAAAAAGAVAVVLLVTSDIGRPHLGRAMTLEGGGHVGEGAALPQRNRPPTSGPHSAGRAAYTVSRTPVETGLWLHVLEHGGIVVLFKCEDDAACSAIADTISRDVYAVARAGRFGERKLAATPYQDMDSPVAAVAWGRVLELPAVDAAQILAFYDRYLDRGPENVP